MSEKTSVSKTKRIDQYSEDAKKILLRQVMQLELAGVSIIDTAKQLALSNAAVRTMRGSEEYALLMSETSQDLTKVLAKTKAQLSALAPDAVKAIKETLSDGSARDKLQAASIVLKAVGLHEEKEAQQDTNIQIILPGGVAPLTYEVTNEETQDG